MKIDNIKLGKYPVLLAPMEDVTDQGFRLMCKEFGADLVYTEFVSSDALILDTFAFGEYGETIVLCDNSVDGFY